MRAWVASCVVPAGLLCALLSAPASAQDLGYDGWQKYRELKSLGGMEGAVIWDASGPMYGWIVATDGHFAAVLVTNVNVEGFVGYRLCYYKRTGAVWSYLGMRQQRWPTVAYAASADLVVRSGYLAFGVPSASSAVEVWRMNPAGLPTLIQRISISGNELFGTDVDLSPDARWLIIGAPAALGTFSGRVQIYERPAGQDTFVFRKTLFCPGGDPGARFGSSVAITSDPATGNVVAAVRADDYDAIPWDGVGAMFVIEGTLNGSTWTWTTSPPIPESQPATEGYGSGQWRNSVIAESSDLVANLVQGGVTGAGMQVIEKDATTGIWAPTAQWRFPVLGDGATCLRTGQEGGPQIDFFLGHPGFPHLPGTPGKIHQLRFDRASRTFREMATVQQENTEPDENSGFGLYFDVSPDGFLCVGDPFWQEAGLDWRADTGSATMFLNDADLDGIPTEWEAAQGVDVDGDGANDIDLMGADPYVKDLFIEFDQMQSYSTSPGRFRQYLSDVPLESAFQDAPVSNPETDLAGNPVTGVQLHVVFDEVTPDETWHTGDYGWDWPQEFDSYSDRHFGTPAERAAGMSMPSLLFTKRRLYRYAVGCTPEASTRWGGIAELPGNDFCVLATGTWEDACYLFMHELGHTLGLHHGGGNDANFKPNYPSVMNYLYNYPTHVNRHLGFDRLDYSREAIEVLLEDQLDESRGIRSADVADPMQSHYKTRHAMYYPIGLPIPRYHFMNGTPIDFNEDFTIQMPPETVAVDLNYIGPPAQGPCEFMTCPSPGQGLDAWNDWANIKLIMGTTGDYADGVHETPPTDEPGEEDIAWLRSLPPPCLPDMDGDLDGDSIDVGLFMQYYHDADQRADMNFDGLINGIDVGIFLHAYGTGCT